MRKVQVKEIFNSNQENIKLTNYDFINYLDTSSITMNHIDNIQKLNIGEETIPSRAKRLIKKDTIVYSLVRPNLKHYGIIRNPLDNMVASTGFITLNIKDKTKNDANYMYYNLTQDKYTDYLHTIACNNVSSYPSINPSDIEDMEIEIETDINNQKKIAKLFVDIDKKIELNNKINLELENIAKKLYDYWFVQFDFPDENERPYKSSGGMLFFDEKYKKLIPIGWKIQNFNSNDLTEIIQPSIDKFENEKIYLPTANIQNDKIIDFSNKITYTNRESRANMQPISNSVWFAKMKNSKKLLYFSDYSKKYLNSLILSTGLCGLYCKNNSLEYIWNTVNREYFEIKKDSLAHGATQQAINNEDLISIPLLIPHQNIIEQYHNKVKAMYKQKYLNEVENIILTRLRDFLLPMLMNGQITIK